MIYLVLVICLLVGSALTIVALQNLSSEVQFTAVHLVDATYTTWYTRPCCIPAGSPGTLYCFTIIGSAGSP